MALPIVDAALLVQVVRRLERRRKVVCLGAPRVAFTGERLLRLCRDAGLELPPPAGNVDTLSAETFFRWLGFEEYLALDVSAYEGAKLVHDLNDPNLPPEYAGVADLIYDGGTLEHVFHLPNALSCIHRLLSVGGVVCHHNPSNGYLDHGFYQLCPTLYHDYYRGNGYRIVTAALVDRLHGMRVRPYKRDVYRVDGPIYGIGQMPRATTFFAARRTDESTCGRIPTQSFYRQMHHGSGEGYELEFEPHFDIVGPEQVSARTAFEHAANQSEIAQGKTERKAAKKASATRAAAAKPARVRAKKVATKPAASAWQRLRRRALRRLRAVLNRPAP